MVRVPLSLLIAQQISFHRSFNLFWFSSISRQMLKIVSFTIKIFSSRYHFYVENICFDCFDFKWISSLIVNKPQIEFSKLSACVFEQSNGMQKLYKIRSNEIRAFITKLRITIMTWGCWIFEAFLCLEKIPSLCNCGLIASQSHADFGARLQTVLIHFIS